MRKGHRNGPRPSQSFSRWAGFVRLLLQFVDWQQAITVSVCLHPFHWSDEEPTSWQIIQQLYRYLTRNYIPSQVSEFLNLFYIIIYNIQFKLKTLHSKMYVFICSVIFKFKQNLINQMLLKRLTKCVHDSPVARSRSTWHSSVKPKVESVKASYSEYPEQVSGELGDKTIFASLHYCKFSWNILFLLKYHSMTLVHF